MAKEELVIFGGSFDPPHLGHAGCLALAMNVLKEAKFVVVPAFAPPSAGGGQKKTVASFKDRLQLCELAFRSLSKDHNLHISNCEEELPLPNFSIQTVRFFQANDPLIQQIYLLIGQDQVQNFHLWAKPLELLESARLLVVRRNQSQRQDIQKDCEFLASQLGLPINWDQDQVTAQIGTISQITILESVEFPESSTEIRKAILEYNIKKLETWLDQNVLRSIIEKRLYF